MKAPGFPRYAGKISGKFINWRRQECSFQVSKNGGLLEIVVAIND